MGLHDWGLYHKPSKKVKNTFELPIQAEKWLERHYGDSDAFEIIDLREKKRKKKLG